MPISSVEIAGPESKLWDGQVAKLQVTDSKESSIELRALASARSAADAFDLRCDIREQLIAFLQKEHPTALPRARAESLRADTPRRGRARGRTLRPAYARTRSRTASAGREQRPLDPPCRHCSLGVRPPMLPPATQARKRARGRNR